jgi:hypothetical protein
MNRRSFLTLLGNSAAALAWPLAAGAQQSDDMRALQFRILRLQAEAAADKFFDFISGIESQIGWTTQLRWSAGTIEQRHLDGLRLVRQVPAITELAQLDPAGIEQLKLSRLGMGAVASNADFSQDPKFTEAVAHKVYYGPVYLRRQSEPYMTLSLAGTRRDAGVSVAEVNLKLIWDVIKAMNVGERSVAYVLNAQNRVIAHSNFRVDIHRDAAGRITVDTDLSLFQDDFSSLAHVQAARTAIANGTRSGSQFAQDINGGKMLTAYALVARPLGFLPFLDRLGWLVCVELQAGGNAPAQ